jgi:sec-independent protein translocase protein TatB
MFENLNWWEIGALLVIALLIFGDKLPNVINDGLRMLRNLRNMANNATSDLSRELGTDIQLADLHPKAFIRKHLLSEEDEAALRRPLEGLRKDLERDLKGVQGELRDVADAADLKRPATSSPAPAASPAASSAPRQAASYDLDAT